MKNKMEIASNFQIRNKLLLAGDFVIVQLSFTGFWILLQEGVVSYTASVYYAATFALTAVLVGTYKITIRYAGLGLVKSMLIAHSTSLLLITIYGDADQFVYFSVASIISFCLMVGVRVLVREFLFSRRRVSGARTLVYGAGDAGVQFVTAVMQGDKYNIFGFIDDDSNLHNSSIYGRHIYPANKIGQIVKKIKIETIVLAMPSVTKQRKKEILDELVDFDIRIVTVPKFQDILDGTMQIGHIQEVHLEDLLGRDAVPANNALLRRNIDGKSVLITGAGGSIGAEICRQIARLNPIKIILLDMSEPSLFAIEQEIIQSSAIEIQCILGTVLDDQVIQRAFEDNDIDMIFHAAAYKHVPMVESNPLSGFINNVLGTKKVLEAAIENRCQGFTLISTDKAVRPTNIMGATKRLSELLCQAYAAKKLTTSISMVRFGNVLGSSGSVIPTFRRQLANGEPLTVTHKEITRYFMTIPEAAQLVIQSSGLADGGDVFLLDMGEPVKIFDLAERLIRLSGKRLVVGNLKSGTLNNSFGQIKVTGLRPGEKLYEELLIGENAEKTQHLKIMRAREPFLELEEINDYLFNIHGSLESGDLEAAKALLKEAGTGYYNP